MLKVGSFVFFLVSYVSVSLLIAPSVNRNVTLFASTFRIIRIILDTLVCLLFLSIFFLVLSLFLSRAASLFQPFFITFVVISLYLYCCSVCPSNIADLPHKTQANRLSPPHLFQQSCNWSTKEAGM